MPHSYVLGEDRSTLHRYELFNAINQPFTEQGFARIDTRPDMQILEIGCGIGDTACWMARHIVPDGHVTAFDQSAELVALGCERAAEQGIGNIRFVQSSAEDFDYGESRFDIAHSRYVLTYLRDAGDVVRQVARSLRPGGCFFGEECVEAHVSHNEPGWLTDIMQWFPALVRSAGGDPNYGLSGLPSHMIEAGLEGLSVAAAAPLEPQEAIVEMLHLSLGNEMKQNLINAGIATDEAVDAAIKASSRADPGAVIGLLMVSQCLAYKSMG
ncbi:class I SAM-dependent methyltransferase [Ruegeria jejuensis]|uniref:class I SAM-dependent methyltransferase n=1 Tax=Ruegeria jejuensis TaxID=3233338 RepID=UPI00355B8FB7